MCSFDEVPGFTWQCKLRIQGVDNNMNVLLDGSHGNYRIHRDSKYDPYILTLSDVQYTDRGFYYCCLPSNCSDDVNGCQEFILRVRGKGYF